MKHEDEQAFVLHRSKVKICEVFEGGYGPLLTLVTLMRTRSSQHFCTNIQILDEIELDLQSQNRGFLLFLHPFSERTTQEQKTLISPIKVFLFSKRTALTGGTFLHYQICTVTRTVE